MTDIPEWAKPLVAARKRGATLQAREHNGVTWIDETDGFAFIMEPELYRIKPGTDPGERTADPLIFGASIPGNEPVPVVEPITDRELWAMYHAHNGTVIEILRYFYAAGTERRRTP